MNYTLNIEVENQLAAYDFAGLIGILSKHSKIELR